MNLIGFCFVGEVARDSFNLLSYCNITRTVNVGRVKEWGKIC